jgi:hypothetical protein
MTMEDARGFRLLGHSDLSGFGDGMQLMRFGDALYVGHFGPSGMGTSILDVSDVTAPELVRQWPAPPNSHTHKVQVADGLLLTNHERFRSDLPWSAGMAVYDLADPFDPHPIGFWESTGRGVHRIVYEGGRYAYVSAAPEGFNGRIWVIVDLDDPAQPVEAGRWWWPGQWTAGGETLTWPEGEDWNTHHAMVSGDRAYVGLWDGGMVILDISSLAAATVISHLTWEGGAATHTCLPLAGRDLVVVTDEAITDASERTGYLVRVVDVSNEKQPRVVSICPEPEGDFRDRGLRFGAHCLHENRPNSYRSSEVVFVTYFNAGLRVFDLADPSAPVEIGYYVPACPPGQRAIQVNDVWVGEDHLVYISDRVSGGIYILEPDEDLAARMTGAALP